MDQKPQHSNGKQPSNKDAEGKANLVGRIEASTVGLMRSSLRCSSPGAVAESLASLNSSAAKGSSSSSALDVHETSSPFGPGATVDRSAASGAYSMGESFRLQLDDSAQNGQYSFDQFMSGRRASLPEKYHVHGNLDQDESQMVISERQAQQGRQPVEAQYFDSTIQKDGAAVTALLSDPKFNTEKPPRPWGFRPHEQNERIDRGHHIDGRPAPADAIITYRPMNSLDLVPDLGFSAQTTKEIEMRISKEVRSKCKNSDALDSMVDENQSWLDIINNYHDEVWGDILPLVHEARKEVKSAQSGMQDLQDRPAIRRLKMLLQHLENPIIS